jgi:hypothetical protein
MRLGIVLFCCVISCSIFAQSTKPTTKAATQPAHGVAAPPPEQLLNSLLKPQTDNNGRVIQPLPDPVRRDPATGNIIAPNPPTPTLKREGQYVIDATGRLTKSADGQSWDFVFDADGQAMQDPPMGVLENLKLESMEQAIAGLDHSPKFRVTGMVTEFKGKNYLLLEKATLVPEVLQQF